MNGSDSFSSNGVNLKYSHRAEMQKSWYKEKYQMQNLTMVPSGLRVSAFRNSSSDLGKVSVFLPLF